MNNGVLIYSNDNSGEIRLLADPDWGIFERIYWALPIKATNTQNALFNTHADMDKKVVFSSCKTTYLIYAMYVCRCGPLVRQWCMRYEAKHKYFKKIAQTLGNFINVPKTVATRHQRFMCYKMTCSTNFLQEENGYGIGKPNHRTKLIQAYS